LPNNLETVIAVLELGPVMTKVEKSSRIEHIASDDGQSVRSQVPDETVPGCVQYVLFSDDDDPHAVNKNVQHTPNPSAHEPELVPLLSEHSALV
jgi:hypothetical protein